MRSTLLAILTLVLLAGTSALPAQSGPTTRPNLEELNRETKALYAQVQTGVYRVELPEPRWLNAYAMAPIDKWDRQLDPEVRRRLPEARVSLDATAPSPVGPHPDFSDATTVGHSKYITVRPPPPGESPDAVLGAALALDRKPAANFSPNNVALLLDDQGHLLVPLYLEREAIGERPVLVAGPDGAVVKARFVGSDRQTNLTLLEVDKPAGKPVRMGKSRPESGSLVLCLSTADGSGRLSLWTDGAQQNGIIVGTDAQVRGIARYGQFLTAPDCRLIAEHLIHFGAVKRATLGITVSEIRQDDPLRRQEPVVGTRTAVRVDEVIAGSVADQAGIKPGDLILSMAGDPVTDLPTFAAAIAAGDGDTPLQILRAGKLITVHASLQSK